MSGNQAYHYDPTTGLPYLIPVPNNRVPPPHPPPSSLGTPQTPEPAPLGSFQNPYPAISTSIPTTHCTPALPPLHGPPHQTQTAEIPIQYLQPTPLLCGCDAFSGEKERDTASAQDHGHLSSSWWPPPPPPGPASSEARPQQTVMLCTRCDQAGDSLPAQAQASDPPPAPSSQQSLIPTMNLTLSPSHPRVTPPPQPPQPPSTYREPTRSTAPTLLPPRPATTVYLGSQDQIPYPDVESVYVLGVRKWADCHVCNAKPALREKEGVLFCLGCWAEADRAERERAW